MCYTDFICHRHSRIQERDISRCCMILCQDDSINSQTHVSMSAVLPGPAFHGGLIHHTSAGFGDTVWTMDSSRQVRLCEQTESPNQLHFECQSVGGRGAGHRQPRLNQLRAPHQCPFQKTVLSRNAGQEAPSPLSVGTRRHRLHPHRPRHPRAAQANGGAPGAPEPGCHHLLPARGPCDSATRLCSLPGTSLRLPTPFSTMPHLPDPRHGRSQGSSAGFCQ